MQHTSKADVCISLMMAADSGDHGSTVLDQGAVPFAPLHATLADSANATRFLNGASRGLLYRASTAGIVQDDLSCSSFCWHGRGEGGKRRPEEWEGKETSCQLVPALETIMKQFCLSKVHAI